LNWTPWVRSLIQLPLTWKNSPAEFICRVAEDRDKVPLPASFDGQHAKAVLRVVERHPVDQTAQDLRQACHRYPRML
jgi:hypothetical protein